MPFPRSLALAVSSLALLPWGAPSLAQEPQMPPRQVLLEKSLELPGNKLNTRVVRVIFPMVTRPRCIPTKGQDPVTC